MTTMTTPATPASYAAEVIADSSGKWCSNGMRWATEAEALMYARDLASRWMLVTDTRVVPSPDPVTYAIVDGAIVPVV